MGGILSSMAGLFGSAKREEENYKGMVAGLDPSTVAGLAQGETQVDDVMQNLNTEFMVGNKLSQQAMGGYKGPGLIAGYAQNEAVVEDYTPKALPADTFSIDPKPVSDFKMGLLYKSDGSLNREAQGFGKQGQWSTPEYGVNPDTGNATERIKNSPPGKGFGGRRQYNNSTNSINKYLEKRGLNRIID